jgi:hypothetical protein
MCLDPFTVLPDRSPDAAGSPTMFDEHQRSSPASEHRMHQMTPVDADVPLSVSHSNDRLMR